MKLEIIDGEKIYYAFFSGGKEVIKSQQNLNDINVFPVADGDTGTNLASTMHSIIEKSIKSVSVSETLRSIADSALLGARGNSGAIFAQFINGLSIGIGDKEKLNIDDFIMSLNHAVEYSYSAVNEPVEGTMLTVISDWVHSMHSLRNNILNFTDLFIYSLDEAKKSLEKTPEKLQILKDSGVVDAGAKGFVTFVEGITKAFKENLFNSEYYSDNSDSSVFYNSIEENHFVGNIDDIKFRYCTEALLQNDEGIDAVAIKESIKSYGDSLVVVSGNDKCRIHIHTNDPSKLFYTLKKYGDIIEEKVDDMKLQYKINNLDKKKRRIAVVTDSTCDLPQDIIDKYNIHILPLSLYFGKSHFLDKVTIKPDQFYDLVDSEETFPKSSQPTVKSFQNLYSFLSSHYDSIIAIHLTKEFSGTWYNSFKASEKIKNKKITVINSKHLSASLGMLVLRAVRAIEKGMEHDEVVNLIESLRNKTINLVSVKTLKYMVKGGRVSPLKGFMAKLLNLKPIVSVDKEGNSKLYGKAFSERANFKKIVDMLDNFSNSGTDLNSYCVVHAHNMKGALKMADLVEKRIGIKPEYIMDISAIVGMNSGRGAVSIGAVLN
ncbi:MAG: fatty acid kinase [Oceanotoga sp.]|uniref:DAK2 domain-containing protein n=1 Tax=Oceanotoga sp. TaxID=2108366 RepID=UPI002655E10D|nr:DegV family protein [Oceanotoga sp.]MDN5343561.1 fatty acid kinase [Oceanotoga sp.]